MKNSRLINTVICDILPKIHLKTVNSTSISCSNVIG